MYINYLKLVLKLNLKLNSLKTQFQKLNLNFLTEKYECPIERFEVKLDNLILVITET